MSTESGSDRPPSPPETSDDAPGREIDHAAPILCLDALLEIDGDAASCRYTVRDAHADDGLLWGGGMIEGMAQTTALLQGRRARASGEVAGPGMLVGIKGLRIHRRPAEGETVVFSSVLGRTIGPLTLAECRTTVGDELLAEGELKFYLQRVDSEGHSA